MAQGIVACTRTDLTSGKTADSSWQTQDLGPAGLNLVPDEGAIMVVVRFFGSHSASPLYQHAIRGYGSTDWDDGSPVLGNTGEDWGMLYVPIPDSGANANEIQFAFNNAGVKLEVLGYVPSAAGWTQLNGTQYTPTVDASPFIEESVEGLLQGGDTMGVVFFMWRDSSTNSTRKMMVAHPDQSESIATWATGAGITPGDIIRPKTGNTGGYNGILAWPKITGTPSENRCSMHRSHTNESFYGYGYLHDSYCTRLHSSNDPIDYSASLDLGGVGSWDTLDFSTDITETTDGAFFICVGYWHKSIWFRDPDDTGDAYPGNSTADWMALTGGSPTLTGSGGGVFWYPISSSETLEYYIESDETDWPFGLMGYAIDGAGGGPTGTPGGLALMGVGA